MSSPESIPHAAMLVNTGELGLWREKSLPFLPIAGGIRARCQIISLDRMIYVLGGALNSSNVSASREVYVYDPAVRRRPSWTRCADMEISRMNFGIGAMHGKIYVFGGCNIGGYVQECEVYDPRVDAWSRIADMEELRIEHHVVALGEWFFVYGGFVDEDSDGTDTYTEDDLDSKCDRADILTEIKVYPDAILVYHPVENKWITWSDVEGGEENLFTIHDLFVVNGNFHRFTLTADTIEIYDIVRKSWSTLHSIVCLSDGKALHDVPADIRLLCGHTILLVDELLIACYIGKNPGAYLLQTKGFSSEDEDIGLEIVHWTNGQFDEDCRGLFRLDV